MSNSIHVNHVSASICEESVSIPKSIVISCCVCVLNTKQPSYENEEEKTFTLRLFWTFGEAIWAFVWCVIKEFY